jgi:molybdopterin/thiamine biosynthesis adenylyltransferase
MNTTFRYEEAFSRNLGWVTECEQQMLREKRVAIAGMGGVGGAHLLTLTRLGIGAFRIADPDRFELVNFNRQAGAALSSIGKPKVDVMLQSAKDINPELRIKSFFCAIDESNVDQFLEGVDLFVDGIDFFSLESRALIFRRCRELGIPAITAAPIGMGTAYLVFLPNGMAFEQYFQFESCSKESRSFRFLSGLAPRPEHWRYLVDRTRIDLEKKRGPSTAMACQLCAAVVGTEAVKILLGRKHVRAVPHYHIFDAYHGTWTRGYLPLGYRYSWDRLRNGVAYKLRPNAASSARIHEIEHSPTTLERILELARWAPSGDNSQPWRFEIIDETRLRVHVRDQANEDIYDRNGDFSLISTGCLLENICLAAAEEGFGVDWSYRRIARHEHRLDIALSPQRTIEHDPRSRFIRSRHTDRRPYVLEPLRGHDRQALESCFDESFKLTWHESTEARLRVALLNAAASDIRLRCREAYDVHRRVIDFERAFSSTGISSRALGLDPILLRIMQWAIHDFTRLDRLNRVLGTGAAQLEMDLLPGWMCSAHFMISFRDALSEEQRAPALLHAGQSIQRFWLEATRRGLSMQPGLAPLIFASYAEAGHPFSASEKLCDQARQLAKRLRDVSGGIPATSLIFAGRIGRSRTQIEGARSIRRSLRELMTTSSHEESHRLDESLRQVERQDIERS